MNDFEKNSSLALSCKHIERRHSVEDAPQQRTSHHQMHPHLHRLISLQHLHNESQDKPTSKDNTAICDTAMTTDEMKITQIAVNCDTAVTTDETKLMHKGKTHVYPNTFLKQLGFHTVCYEWM